MYIPNILLSMTQHMLSTTANVVHTAYLTDWPAGRPGLPLSAHHPSGRQPEKQAPGGCRRAPLLLHFLHPLHGRLHRHHHQVARHRHQQHHHHGTSLVTPRQQHTVNRRRSVWSCRWLACCWRPSCTATSSPLSVPAFSTGSSSRCTSTCCRSMHLPTLMISHGVRASDAVVIPCHVAPVLMHCTDILLTTLLHHSSKVPKTWRVPVATLAGTRVWCTTTSWEPPRATKARRFGRP